MTIWSYKESGQRVEREIRREVKFAVPLSRLPQLDMEMQTHPALLTADYPERQVNNLYFDDMEFTRYRLDSERLGRLRLRWYDDQGRDILLQAKGTQELAQVKFQQEICLPAHIHELSFTELRQFLRKQAASTFLPGLLRGDEPVLANSYRRRYYSNSAHQVRFTIDHDIRTFDQFHKSSLNTGCYIPINIAVAELKIPFPSDININELLQHFKMRLFTRPKYRGGMDRIWQDLLPAM